MAAVTRAAAGILTKSKGDGMEFPTIFAAVGVAGKQNNDAGIVDEFINIHGFEGHGMPPDRATKFSRERRRKNWQRYFAGSQGNSHDLPIRVCMVCYDAGTAGRVLLIAGPRLESLTW